MESVTNLETLLPQAELSEFCRENGIRSLALFGSFLHGKNNEASDIDFLVEYDSQQKIGLFAVTRLEMELSALLKRSVELRTAQDLSVYFRQQVLSEAQVIYES